MKNQERPKRKVDRPRLRDYNDALHAVLRDIPGAYAAIEKLRVTELVEWENDTTEEVAKTLNIPASVAKVAVKHSRMNSSALTNAQRLNDLLTEVSRIENES